MAKAGTRGPAPKPVDARVGHRAVADDPDIITKIGHVNQPDPRHHWDDEVVQWYQSFADAAHTGLWDTTDWQEVLRVGDQYQWTRENPSAAAWEALSKGMARLGATDVDRRRAGIEVHRVDPDAESSGAAVQRLKQLKNGG